MQVDRPESGHRHVKGMGERLDLLTPLHSLRWIAQAPERESRTGKAPHPRRVTMAERQGLLCNAAVLGPGKARQAQASWLGWLQASERCQWWEMRYDLEGTRRQDRPERVALTHHCTDLQGGHFAESTHYRRPDTALVDLVPQPLDGRCGGGHVAFQLVNLTLEALEAGEAVTLLGALFALQAADREAERVDRSPALVNFSLGAREIELRREAAHLQKRCCMLISA
jgi:hypothetical protein